MSENKFPKDILFNLPALNLPKIDIHSKPSIIDPGASHQKNMKRMSDEFDQMQRIKREKEIAQTNREEKQIELLEDIKNNTGSLVNMVNMIRFNSDQQTEIMLIITEILAIGTASTPEEAESLYKKVTGKINHTIESGENIAKLTTWATAAWTLVNKIPL